MKIHSLRLVTLALVPVAFLAAQPADDTQLKQVIIFGRHGVRSQHTSYSILNSFSAQPYPFFSSSNGDLTNNGKVNETILGSYYRLWLTKEGLLTGNDSADADFVYFRATATPLIIDTARAFAAGMLPQANVFVNTQQGSDPLFDPLGAGVARLNQRMAIAAVQGRLGGNAQSLVSAYASELALTRSILFGYAAGATPVPATPAGKVDVTAIPFDVTDGQPGLPVGLGGLATVNVAIDPFIFEYADGLTASEVGWGQLTAGGISQITRLLNVALDLEYRTPYLARVQSSNAASHVVRSMVQAATGNAMTGSVGNPSTKVIVLMAANTNVTGLAGLLNLDWIVPGYVADESAPGGVLMFELRQSQSTGEYIVRASYAVQTMDQLRNRTVLTLNSRPAIAPVFIPGCSMRNATFDCPLASFVEVAEHAIDPESADLVN